MRRRHLLLGACVAPALSGCGFRLRGAASFAFSSISLSANESSGLTQEVRRYLASAGALQVLGAGMPSDRADVILELRDERRQRSAAGRSASGQVRELELLLQVKFRLVTPRGVELIALTELEQRRDISYNESQALAKEAEEALLVRDMESTIAQLLVRRLSAVRVI